MPNRPSLQRWIRPLISSVVIGTKILLAEAPATKPTQKSDSSNPPIRANPNIDGVNKATRLTDEVADSLEKRLRTPNKERREFPESENVLRRQVKKVVVDETKVWRDMVDGAVQAYERSTKPEDQIAAESILAGIIENPDSPLETQRDCLKHLAQFALDSGANAKAQQIYSQLVSRYPLHPDTPSILYRQGVLYRKIGATELALSKFHAVMSTVVSLQVKDISTYRSLVLLAQTEIADTFLMAGQFDRAADYYRRVLKLGDSDLNEAQIRLKLVKAVFELKDWKGVLAEGLQCIEKAALSSQIAEVRFLMAEAYKKLGMHQEAIQQTLELLNTEQEKANKDPDNWAYWQKRTGNKLANELYEQGDYLNALLIYETLFKLPGNAEWHSQALYQIGLIYERMFQPDRAAAAYSEIISQPTNAAIAVSATNTAAQATATSSTNGALSNLPQPAVSGKKVATPSPAQPVSPGLNLIREMALWRLNNLRWDQKVNQEVQKIFLPNTSSTNNRISEPQNSTP